MLMCTVLRTFLLLLFYYCKCSLSKAYLSKCGKDGFTCDKTNVIFHCPTNNETFSLWAFNAPYSIKSIKIVNCQTLQLSFQCTSDKKYINHLKLENITNLYIVSAEGTLNPQTIEFENITNLEYIPENTFSQNKKDLYYRKGNRCINLPNNLENLYFNKVNIGVIAPNAFDLKDLKNFSWNEVNIKRVQHLAVQLKFNKGGNFSISKSNFEVCENLAFKLFATQAIFVENKFIELYSVAINATSEIFIFNANNVNNMQAYAISLLAEHVQITKNKFEYLETNAFAKISPGLMYFSPRNFGHLFFTYEFSNNFVNFMGAASLNPDVQAYNNVATEIKFDRNVFHCSCENLGWLFSGSGYGYTTKLLQDFYDNVIEEDNNNQCEDAPCKSTLSLKSARDFIKNRRCFENRTLENLCGVEIITSTQATKATGKTKKKFKAKGMSNDLIKVNIFLFVSVQFYNCFVAFCNF